MGPDEADEVHVMINKTNLAQQWVEAAYKDRKDMMETSIPEHYKEYAEVFSEEAAKRFPPSRDNDHAINFKEGAPDKFKCKIYPISAKETKFLQDWVDENLGKKFIQESKSQFVSPMFLIKKKNGDYRVIQDY